jgi:hypothetical protein
VRQQAGGAQFFDRDQLMRGQDAGDVCQFDRRGAAVGDPFLTDL